MNDELSNTGSKPIEELITHAPDCCCYTCKEQKIADLTCKLTIAESDADNMKACWHETCQDLDKLTRKLEEANHTISLITRNVHVTDVLKTEGAFITANEILQNKLAAVRVVLTTIPHTCAFYPHLLCGGCIANKGLKESE